MHQRMRGVVIVKAFIDLSVCHCDGMTDIAAGQSLAKDEDIRQNQIRRKAVSGTPESCGDFIENQEYAILIAKLARAFQKGNIVHPHTSRALQQRFYDKAVQAVMVFCKGLFEGVDLRGNVQDMTAFPIRLQNKVIVFIVPHFHGLERIAVIGVLQRQYHSAPVLSPVHVVLQRHFKGDLYRNAAGIREKAVIQIPGQPALEFLG